MRIFVDAMGGDNAPKEIVQGCVDAANEYHVQLTLVGDESQIKQTLSLMDYPKQLIDILPSYSVIDFNDEPVKAIREKTDSSIVVALEAAKQAGPDSVVVSAGSTGALLAGGLFKLGRIKGIKRPALGTPIPTKNHITLLLDSGANADCKAEYLQQFAILGTIYYQNIYQQKHPKVALLNIGTETEKGNTLTKEAFQLLSKTNTINFIGNIESRDIMDGKADIIVTDGFTGNIVLKQLEGLSNYLLDGLKQAILSSVRGKIGGAFIQKDLKSFKHEFSSDEVGGAPFLGVRGGLIKAHGSSKAYAIQNAIKQAIAYMDRDIIAKINNTINSKPVR
jgi:glycerol-3-phosphate acyltransferase PlsX